VSSSPILVTGSHRSGTTWVGDLLGRAAGVAPIHEPLNPVNRLSWLNVQPEYWFQHIDEVNAEQYRPAFERLLAMRPPLGRHLATVRTPRNLAANVRELGLVVRGRSRTARPLVKDPIAFFAAEWLACTFNMQVVVLIRHPAAFAGSLKRNGWEFDFRNLTEQPRLVEAYLGAFAEEIAAAAARPPDLIDQAILLWRCINSVALRYRDRHSDWHVWRYEDVAVDPERATRALYEAVGLPWSDSCARYVRATSAADNPAEVAIPRTRDVRRDSAGAIWTWRDRLSTEEVERVRAGTADIACRLYSEDDWDWRSSRSSIARRPAARLAQPRASEASSM
jgi:Sulfotransferase family